MIGFRKVHGAGNDFIVVTDPAETQDWSALAKRLCKRQTGIGADGLIVSMRSAAAEYAVRRFNPDGSVASMCGNGLRCTALCAAEDHGDQQMVLVMEGIEHQALVRGSIAAVTVLTGAVTARIAEVARDGQLLSFSSVDTGTEHVVALTEDADRIDLADLGRAVRYHPALARQARM
jgi:diaminopimelate epimerase